MNRIRLIGPPGTGKTTELLRRVKELHDRGFPTEAIGFLSFSRAAVLEARSRIGLPKEKLPYWSTVHALAYRELKIAKGSIITGQDMTAFGSEHHYAFTGNARFSARPIEALNDSDALLLAYHYGRATGNANWEHVAERFPKLSATDIAAFAVNIARYKARVEKIDFHDLLDRAIGEKAVPDAGLAYLYVDETQDLTPVQHQYIRMVIEANAETLNEVMWAGDWAQAIYGYCGAVPELMRSLEVDEELVLSTSHRLPDQLCRYACGLTRDAVPFHGRATEESHIRTRVSLTNALEGINGQRTFILARSNYLVGRLAVVLASRGFDFTRANEGFYQNQLRLALGHMMLAHNNRHYTISAETLETIVEMLSAKELVIPRGYKASVQNPANPSAMIDLTAEPWWVYCLMRHDAGEIHRAFLPPYRHGIPRLLGVARTSGAEKLLTEPTITLATIHQAKGKECDRTILIPALPKRVVESLYGNPENEAAEARLWYVAATRCRQELVIVNPYDPEFAMFNPYPLPEPEEVVI